MRVFLRTKFEGLKIIQGWCFEYKNEVSKLYETTGEAKEALSLKMLFDTKPQRGRSDFIYPKPQRGSIKTKGN